MAAGSIGLSDSVDSQDQPNRRDVPQTQLDRDYSPSLWNNRGLTSEETIRQHVSVTTQASEEARCRLHSIANIRYGSTDKNILDLYSFSIHTTPGAQLVVYVHGGYWQFLSKEESAFLALPVCTTDNLAGCNSSHNIFLAVDYVLATEKQHGKNASMSGICQQMQELFVFVGRLAQLLKCSGVNFIGHSAGAHLVATMLSQLESSEAFAYLPLLRGVWLVSGIYDLQPISKTYVNEPLNLTSREIQECSPIHLVTSLVKNLMYAPYATLKIIFGQHDSLVFRDQSRLYQQKIKEEVDRRLEEANDHSDKSCFVLEVPLEIASCDHFTVVDQLKDGVLVQDIQHCLVNQSKSNRLTGTEPEHNIVVLNDVDYAALLSS